MGNGRTAHSVNYIAPFLKCKTFIPPHNSMNLCKDIVYGSMNKSYNYNKQRPGKCIKVYKLPKKVNFKSNALNDDIYDERQQIKDLKTKKTRGGRRKRRKRTYILKSEIRHRRRHQKKKHRKNVYHFNKRKRIKSKMAKGYIYIYYEWYYLKKYCWQSRRDTFQIGKSSRYYHRNRKTNKHILHKIGRKNTRKF